MSATDVLPAQVVDSGGTSATRLLTVAQTAEWLGVHPTYVYRHADALAGIRLPGDKANRGRLRFDRQRTIDALTARSSSEQSQLDESPVSAAQQQPTRLRTKRARSGTRTTSGAPLLKVAGDD